MPEKHNRDKVSGDFFENLINKSFIHFATHFTEDDGIGRKMNISQEICR